MLYGVVKRLRPQRHQIRGACLPVYITSITARTILQARLDTAERPSFPSLRVDPKNLRFRLLDIVATTPLLLFGSSVARAT